MASSGINKLPDEFTFKRVAITKTAIVGDTKITNAEILTNVVKKPNAPYCIIPEGIRPLTSWNTDVSMFWYSTESQWSIHNRGTAGDIEATFIVMYVPSQS